MMKRILKVVLVALMVVASTIRVDAKSTISQRVQNIIDNMSSTDKVDDSSGSPLDYTRRSG